VCQDLYPSQIQRNHILDIHDFNVYVRHATPIKDGCSHSCACIVPSATGIHRVTGVESEAASDQHT
jgi:tRNA A37 methylthiotransferase MiaB